MNDSAASEPLLEQALLGNSLVLATVDSAGCWRRFFWPYLDWAQQLDGFALGVAGLPGWGPRWLRGPGWSHQQAYVPDSNVLQTVSRLEGAAWHLERRQWAPAGVEALAAEIIAVNDGGAAVSLSLLAYLAMDIDESPSYNTALWDPHRRAVFFYRRGNWFAFGADRTPSAFTCAKQPGAWLDLQDGLLDGEPIATGDVDAAQVWHLGELAPGDSATLRVWLVGGQGRAAAGGGLDALRGDSSAPIRPLGGAGASLGAADATAGAAGTTAVEKVHSRSLALFRLVSSERTGAILGAPEYDPGFRHSGGYAYTWPRDGAYAALAMDAAGMHEQARRFYRWTASVQEPSGHWVQRYYADGAWGPSWGLLQPDQTGTVLFGAAEHYRHTRDDTFLADVYPAVARAADYLADGADPRTGLTGPGYDLWEERVGQFAYTAAATYGGLKSAAELGRRIGDRRGQVWEDAAEALREAVLQGLWSEPHGHFLRALRLEVGEGEAVRARARGLGVIAERVPGSLRERLCLAYDPTLDASLLGLAVPFGLVDPADRRMRATVAKLETALTNRGAGEGIGRYPGDTYRGGNPWLLCTLWLGWYLAHAGEELRAREILRWAAGCATPLGYLPEQVEVGTGRPLWVAPLTWSHALFVLLATRLEQGRPGG